MDMSSSLKGPLQPSEAEVRIAAELAGGSVLGDRRDRIGNHRRQGAVGPASVGFELAGPVIPRGSPTRNQASRIFFCRPLTTLNALVSL